MFDVPKVLLTSAPAPYSDLRQGEPFKFYLCHYSQTTSALYCPTAAVIKMGLIIRIKTFKWKTDVIIGELGRREMKLGEIKSS